MFKAGQIYRFNIGRIKNIYIRLLPFSEGRYGDLLVLAGTIWGQRWYVGNVIGDYAYLEDWTLIEEINCIKCGKKNPCRVMEILCSGCRI